MNRFFTEVQVNDVGWKMSYQDKMMLMGSCFSENIGEKLKRRKFQVDVNPFGIIYNPLSVAKSIRILLSGKTYRQEDLFENNGIWGSFDHHGRFSSTSAGQTLSAVNNQLEYSRAFLRESAYLLITLGTSWVYELKATGKVVSNCHKFPAGDFKRFRITPGEIVAEFREVLTALWKFNPELKVLFTVSPVRHLKDGAVGNQLSKAALLLATDRLITGFGNERCAYFPSYEIMMDELRDYRFYAPDLLHLNQVAVDYIWERFAQVLISEDCRKMAKNVLKIVKAREHRPFNPETVDYKEFLWHNLNEIRELTINFPYLNFDAEKNHFESELRESQQKDDSK